MSLSPTAAVVLLSGGLDSAVTLAIAKAEGFEPHALSFDYKQRHRVELEAAVRVADAQGIVDHRTAQIDLRIFGGSALTDDIAVPKNRDAERIGAGIPITYVPARNTLFLSYALAYAEVIGARDIFIGVNAIDYSGYPDCRPEFIEQFEKLANIATRAGVSGDHFRIRTPLGRMTKAQIVRRGHELGVDFALTHSCYDPAADGAACGRCDSCQLRLAGFRDAGMIDPIRYSATSSRHAARRPS